VEGRDGGEEEERKRREKETGRKELIDRVIGGTARANAKARRARAKCDRVFMWYRVARLIAGFQFNNAIMRCLFSSLPQLSLSPQFTQRNTTKV